MADQKMAVAGEKMVGSGRSEIRWSAEGENGNRRVKEEEMVGILEGEQSRRCEARENGDVGAKGRRNGGRYGVG